jgi:hypothetical protein
MQIRCYDVGCAAAMQRLLGRNRNMTRRILTVAMALAIVAALLYFWYGSYGAKRAGADGQVYSNDSSSGRLKSSSNSDTSNSQPVSNSPASASQPVTYPPAAEQAERTAAGTPASSGVPATDSISPNPTNGQVFAGTGKYQLYRQGNLTWRLDTDTGQTCIIFATDEEWKKAKVMNAGCRGR